VVQLRKINVFLLAGALPIYKELTDFPPHNVNYLSKGTVGAEVYYSRYYMLKRKFLSKIMDLLRIPRMTFLNVKNADLIHSSRGILILNRKPWVIDVDHATAFVGFDIKKWEENRYRNLVKKFLSSNYCKKIMPWSEAAKKSLTNSIDISKFEEKVETIYPAVHVFNKQNKKSSEKIRLLFVSSIFYQKGGREVLQAYEYLRNKYDIELVVKSDISAEMRKKHQDVKFHPYKSQLLSRDELLKNFYSLADIFVYPTFVDFFGLGLLDAMSCGLPIVATDIFAIPEIVENGKNGFLVHPPISWYGPNYLWNKKTLKIITQLDSLCLKNTKFVKQLVDKLSILIEDSSLRKKMGRYGRRLVEKGKFSIKERNKKLKRIYEEALRC